MTITKEAVLQTITTLDDGQLVILETITYTDDSDGSSHSVREKRLIDVGDDVTAEDQLIKDVAGGAHTAGRKTARDAVKGA